LDNPAASVYRNLEGWEKGEEKEIMEQKEGGSEQWWEGGDCERIGRMRKRKDGKEEVGKG